MTALQVVCVTKGNEYFPYSGITSLRAGGMEWTPEHMALHIWLGMGRFYTVDPISGLRAEVEPRKTAQDKWYVTTQPDPVTGNNLENLAACSVGAY